MAEIKQYVNLDPTKPEQLDGLDRARAGKTVSVVATVKPASAGVPVAFEIRRGAGNLTLAGVNTVRIETTNDQGKATLRFEMTEAGGDEFTITASVAKGPNKDQLLSSDKYVVWRRFYYQLSRFGAGAVGKNQVGPITAVGALDLDPVKAELAARKHNIELVDKSVADPLITRHANVLTDEDDSRAYKDSGADGYDATREPVTVRFLIVHQIATPKEAMISFAGQAKDATASFKAPQSLWKDATLDETMDWLVSAEWSWSYNLTWGPLARACLSKIGNKIILDLGAMKFPSRGASVFSETVEVRIKYRYVADQTNGVSWHNGVWLASSSMIGGARTAAEMQQTAIHELGHFIDMVPTAQATHYKDHGHQGGHCTTGLSAEDQLKASYGGLPGTCIMFGENGERRLSQFCAECAPSVRKSPVKRSGMPASWRQAPAAAAAPQERRTAWE